MSHSYADVRTDVYSWITNCMNSETNVSDVIRDKYSVHKEYSCVGNFSMLNKGPHHCTTTSMPLDGSSCLSVTAALQQFDAVNEPL